MMVTVYVDGSCRGNGTAEAVGGIGIVAYESSGIKVCELAFRINDPHTTNNEMEYFALATALESLFKDNAILMPPTKTVTFYSDSKLVVNQVNGLWQIKNEYLKSYYLKIRDIIESAPCKINVEWVPREKNKEADNLAQSITEVSNG